MPHDDNSEKPGGLLSSLVAAEAYVQIAFYIPGGTILGWLAGVGLDHWLHTTWLYIAGLVLGAAAGFVLVFRTVARLMK